jgi:hypothetical protein
MIRASSGRDEALVMAPGVTAMEDPDGDVTLFDSRRGRYWRGNPGSRDVLALLRSPVTGEEIVDVLHARYEAERDVISRDVESLVKQLLTARLIRRVRT